MRQLLRSTLIVTTLSVFNVAVGFLNQMVLAAKFGNRMEMDAYLTAISLPLLITTALVGSLNVTFIPIFIEYETRGSQAEAWRIASSFINIVVVTLVLVAAFGMVAAEPIVDQIAPGFAHGTAVYELTVGLTRLVFPTIVANGLVGLVSSLYYAEARFAQPSLAPVVNGSVLVAGVLLFSNQIGIYSVAVGMLLGGIAQFALLLPILSGAQRYQFVFDYRHPGVVRIAKLVVPLIAAALFYRATTLIERWFASGLPEGSISALGYAFKLISTLGVITSSGLAISIFPLLSRQSAEGDMGKLRETFSLGLRVTFLMIMPITVGLAVLREPIIQLFLERGAFNHVATEATATVLPFYLGVLVFGAIGGILGQGFYIFQDTKTVAMLGILEIIFYSAVAFVLVRYLSYLGLALAQSILFVASSAVMTLILRKRLGHLDGMRILHLFAQVVFASLITATVAFFFFFLLSSRTPLFFSTGAAVSAGAAVYGVVILYVFQVPEARWLLQILVEKLKTGGLAISERML